MAIQFIGGLLAVLALVFCVYEITCVVKGMISKLKAKKNKKVEVEDNGNESTHGDN